MFLSPGSHVRTAAVAVVMPADEHIAAPFLGHLSHVVPSLHPDRLLRPFAHQPVGTGSAQIRWSICPNRRRVIALGQQQPVARACVTIAHPS